MSHLIIFSADLKNSTKLTLDTLNKTPLRDVMTTTSLLKLLLCVCLPVCISLSSNLFLSLYMEQNYKRNTFVFDPIFHELNSKI